MRPRRKVQLNSVRMLTNSLRVASARLAIYRARVWRDPRTIRYLGGPNAYKSRLTAGLPANHRTLKGTWK